MTTKILVVECHTRTAQVAWRSLKKAGYQAIPAVQSDKRDETLRILPSAASLVHPDPWRESPEFLLWLKTWLQQNPTGLVLPISEASIFIANQLRTSMQAPERFVMAACVSLKYALSKYNATQAADRSGIKIPNTHFFREPGKLDFQQPSMPLEYPALMKWDNTETPKGQYEKGDLTLVNSDEELQDVLAELSPSLSGVIAQQLVPGHGVGAFFLRVDGKFVLEFAHHRRHEVPWTGGISAYCESSDDSDVLMAGRRLLEAIDYEGVAMVEFRKQDGREPVFMEINGRLWGSLGLAVAAGADFPRAMVDCQLNGDTKVKQPSLSRRVQWHDPALEMACLRSYLTKATDSFGNPAPRKRGSMQIVANFLNTEVKSDWWHWKEPMATAWRYARWFRQESAKIMEFCSRADLLNGKAKLVEEAVQRTQTWLQSTQKPRKLLFLCNKNICRSPYAEVRWNTWQGKDSGLPEAFSAGFHEIAERQIPERFLSAARQRGVELDQHNSRRVCSEMLVSADVVFVMDRYNLESLKYEFPDALDKTLLLGALCDLEDPEIPDPYDQNLGAGGAVYRRIDSILEFLATNI